MRRSAFAKVDNLAAPETNSVSATKGGIVTATLSRLAVLAGCWTLLSWCSAHAGDIPYSKDYHRCIDASGGNTFSMIECTTAETARWDKRLNATYKSLLATSDPARQKALTAAEAAWMKFRDSNCDFIFDPNGGQAARMAANDCVLRMTAERALELESFKPN
jgi:uncharacterized protein YecT (DUF1311 family)